MGEKGTELRLREGERVKGKRSRRLGSELGRRASETKLLIPGSLPAHFAGLVPASILSIGCAALMVLAL
jgi:hypothetical protein